jgi:uncharacterized lipoprotein YddW (UPF0748 family)
MRLLKCAAVALLALTLVSCGEKNFIAESNEELNYTRPNESIVPELTAESQTETSGYIPINYQNQIGEWFPYMDYAEYMQNKSADEFRSAVREKFSAAAAETVNTVYVHVRAWGDAYYNSEIFPKGTYLDGDYDPLQIMIEEAHALNLSLHAWINPLRCQTPEQLKELPDDFILKEWIDTDYMSLVNGRYYLNPAYDEVIDLICSGAEEICTNYDVDGLHIDDYFYPTTDTAFDESAFSASESDDLSQWRLDNCSRMVHSIYEAIKSIDSNILFGISPQGNISANYSTQYADVRLWGSTDGYCDYIVPQIYFGFNNETCPFAETLSAWESLVTNKNTSLIIGLAAYKLGTEDKWAGAAGEQEWIENDDIISRQIDTVQNSSAAGYALYY